MRSTKIKKTFAVLAKIYSQYSRDASDWCSDKKEKIFLKKTNQHWTLYLDPQRLGPSHYNKEKVVISCMNILKYTLIGYIPLSNGGWRKII